MSSKYFSNVAGGCDLLYLHTDVAIWRL